MIFSGTVRLCKTGLIGKSCLPIGKQLRFVSTSGAFVTSLERRFGQCDCPEHAALNEVHFGKTALYSPVLARGILNAMKEVSLGASLVTLSTRRCGVRHLNQKNLNPPQKKSRRGWRREETLCVCERLFVCVSF